MPRAASTRRGRAARKAVEDSESDQDEPAANRQVPDKDTPGHNVQTTQSAAISFIPLYISLALFVLAGLILLSGEMRQGNLVIWNAQGKLAPAYQKPQRKAHASTGPEGGCAEDSAMKYRQKEEEVAAAEEAEEQMNSPDEAHAQESPTPKPKEDTRRQEEEEEGGGEGGEGGEGGGDRSALRFDLTTVTATMPYSTPLIMQRAAQNTLSDGGRDTSDSSDNSDNDADMPNFAYVPNTAAALEISRESLLSSSRSSSSSAMLTAIRSKKLPMLMSVAESANYPPATAWDMWALAAQWPVLAAVQTININVNVNIDTARSESDVDRGTGHMGSGSNRGSVYDHDHVFTLDINRYSDDEQWRKETASEESDMHTLDLLLDSRPLPPVAPPAAAVDSGSIKSPAPARKAPLHFYVCENFRVFDSLVSRSDVATSAGARANVDFDGYSSARAEVPVSEQMSLQYPHGMDLNTEGQHDPFWWRKFQFAPVEPEPPATASASVSASTPAEEISEAHIQTAQEKAKVENVAKEEKEAAEIKKRLLEPPLPQLWIMSPGAALQARYYEGHTVRMQLSGTVRYTLFSSNMLHAMHLYPSYSGRAWQSQVPMYRTSDHMENMQAVAERKNLANLRKNAGNSTSGTATASASIKQTKFPDFYNALLSCEYPEHHHRNSGKTEAEHVLMGCLRFATLTPGQLLYIPPYWTVLAEVLDAHATSVTLKREEQAAADTETIGAEAENGKQTEADMKKPHGGGVAAVIDMHSSSNAQLILAEAWHMRIPIVDALKGSDKANSTITPAERVIATQIYAVHVLSRLTAAGSSRNAADSERKKKKGKESSNRQRLDALLKSPKAFAENLYRSRYESLYPRGSLFMQQQLKEFRCYRIENAGADQDVRKQKENEENQRIIRSVVEKLDHRLIQSRAQFIADAFLDASLDTEHAGIRIVWLQSYIERLAFWAMGGDENSTDDSLTGLFLLQCLYQDEMLTIVEEVEGETIRLSDFTEN